MRCSNGRAAGCNPVASASRFDSYLTHQVPVLNHRGSRPYSGNPIANGEDVKLQLDEHAAPSFCKKKGRSWVPTAVGIINNRTQAWGKTPYAAPNTKTSTSKRVDGNRAGTELPVFTNTHRESAP